MAGGKISGINDIFHKGEAGGTLTNLLLLFIINF